MEEKELTNRLANEFGYPENGARIVAKKIIELSPKLKNEFFKFWDTGFLTDIDIHGYTISRLMEEHNMKPVAAFLTLDWLEREPDKAKESLRKGHDFVK